MEGSGGLELRRTKRIWYPGATYHVMSRGNRRTPIFREEEDYLDFLQCLLLVRESFGLVVHSLCLMTNHFHIAMETRQKELWKIMHRLLLTYATHYNRKYNLTGHLFESRYTAQLIEDERYFLEVSRYIHLNPVKARMVLEPAAYEYSSYERFVQESGQAAIGPQKKFNELISELVETSRVLSCFRHNPQEQYRMFVEGKISHVEQELLIQRDMREDDMWLPW